MPSAMPATSGRSSKAGMRDASAENNAATTSAMPKCEAKPIAAVFQPPSNAALPNQPLAMTCNSFCGAMPL